MRPVQPHAEPAPELLAALRGEGKAFDELTGSYRRELLTHCYRMVGSFQEAEDLVQETYLRAWRRLETYAGRASFRAWMYQIATNLCLDALKQRPKRSLPAAAYPPSKSTAALPPPDLEPVWIEPYPDELLAPAESGPEALIEARESISLAFMVAIHALPARQRCALILGDVLDWPIEDIAVVLETSSSAVHSLLHRARRTLQGSYASEPTRLALAAQASRQTQEGLERYLHAWEAADIGSIVALLTEDASFSMPPFPTWFRGRSAIRKFLSETILAGDARGRFRLFPVHANGQPGFAFYQLSENGVVYAPFALQVLHFAGELFAEVTTFGLPHMFSNFGLPVELRRD